MSFSLEKEIKAWKDQLHQYHGLEPEYIDELEDHIRNSIEELLDEDKDEEQAFKEVIAKDYYDLKPVSDSFIEYRKYKQALFPGLNNYFKTAIRVMKKNASLTLLNVFGLAIGIAAFLLINTFVIHQLNFDQFHDKKDRLFRVTHQFYKEGQLDYHGASTFPRVGPAMKDEFPEVLNQCRLFKKYRPGTVRFEDQMFREENLFYADSTFFKVFSYPLISGNPNSILTEPNTAVVDEATAQKYFGEEDPLGKKIWVGSMDGEEEFEIVGVFKSVKNSHLQFTFIFSYSSLVHLFGATANTSWSWYDFYTYILLNDNADVVDFESKLKPFIDKHGGERLGSKQVGFELQPIDEIYLHSDLVYEPGKNGDFGLIQLLIAISFFILIIAWVNYINLYTAKAIQRAKEVGIRKVLGSSRSQLIWQFLIEAFTVNGISMFIGLILFIICIPWFNEFTYLQVDAQVLTEIRFILILIGLWLAGSFLSGLYPAFVLASIKPIPAIKGLIKNSGSGAWLRKSFIVIQFVISSALISATLIIQEQIDYIQHQGLKIETDNLLVIRAPDAIIDANAHAAGLRNFRDKLLNHHQITNASVASEIPGKGINWWGGVRKIGAPSDQRTTIYRMGIDQNYLSLYGDIFIAGRNFIRDYDQNSVILNESAIRKLGFESSEKALNEFIITGRDTLSVLGVVKDYHQEILKVAYKPTLFLYEVPAEMKFVTIQLDDPIDGELLGFIESVFQSIFPNAPFDHFFVSEYLQDQYESEKAFFKSFSIFAGMAIIIALLGLVGLTSFFALQKTKEVCIRKIHGSTILDTYIRLSSELLKYIMISNLIAIPLIIIFSDYWLSQFAFNIEFNWLNLVITFGITLMLAILTISKSILQVSLANPLDKLRYE